MKFQSLALVQCCQWMFKNNKLFERNITSFWFWCAHFFQLILVSFLSSLIAPFLQISVLFILWVIHVCSDLRLHGFEGEGLGGLRIRVHWGRLRYEIKEDDIPSLSPPPLPLLNHDKNPRSSQKPIDSLLVLQKSPRKTTFINSDLYLLSLFSVLLTHGEESIFLPALLAVTHSLRATWRTVPKCVLNGQFVLFSTFS